MARFDFQRFLAETGVSLTRLASHLRVAPSYLQAAAAGQGKLTGRDQEACRRLWRRLTKAVQLPLPFAESPHTFTRQHARQAARDRVLAAARPSRRKFPAAAGSAQSAML
jgi:hypothetical protein